MNNSRMAVVALTLCVLPRAAVAEDPALTSNKSVEWDYVEGMTEDGLNKLLAKRNMRVIDLQVTDSIHAVLVKNTGAFARKAWWYYHVSESYLKQKLDDNHARLEMFDTLSLDGKVTFDAVMVENTEHEKWWWYYNLSIDQIKKKLDENDARPTFLTRFWTDDVDRRNVIMVENKGATKSTWWWYYNVSPGDVEKHFKENNARLISFRLYDKNEHTYDAVMVPAGDKGWYWYHGVGSSTVLADARKNNARIVSGAFGSAWILLGTGPGPKCGAVKQDCCPGNLCNTGAMCQSSVTYGSEYGFGGGGVCQKQPTTGSGSTGGGNTGGGNTGGGNTGGGCGSGNQKCCDHDVCHKGFACQSGTCRAVSTSQCGTIGSSCCPPSSAGSECSLGATCSGAICQPCGGKGEYCCHGTNTAGGMCDLGLTCNGVDCR